MMNRADTAPMECTEHTVQSSGKTTDQEIMTGYVPSQPVVGGPSPANSQQKTEG